VDRTTVFTAAMLSTSKHSALQSIIEALYPFRKCISTILLVYGGADRGYGYSLYDKRHI
jgi:hypothetical protein